MPFPPTSGVPSTPAARRWWTCAAAWTGWNKGIRPPRHPGHQPGFLLFLSCRGARSPHSRGRLQSCLHQCCGRGLARAIHAPHPLRVSKPKLISTGCAPCGAASVRFLISSSLPAGPRNLLIIYARYEHDFSAGAFARCRSGVRTLRTGPQSRGTTLRPLHHRRRPARSDTMMVLHADGDAELRGVVPARPRVDVPGLGTPEDQRRVQQGPAEGHRHVEGRTSTSTIQHYLEVNFKTFEDIVNAVGSVPVYFPYQARDQLTGLGPSHYGRAATTSTAPPRSRTCARATSSTTSNGRWVDASPPADIDRIERQQDFIKKLGRIAVRRPIDDPIDRARPRRPADPEPHRRPRRSTARVQPAGAGVHGPLRDDGGGPTFETLPWKMGDSAGSFLLVKQPEADAVLAVLRGEAPIPTTTTAAARHGVAPAARGTTRAGGAPVRRAGAGAQRLRGAERRGRQHRRRRCSGRASCPAASENDPAAPSTTTEIRYAASDLAKAQLVAERRARRPAGAGLHRCPAPTSCWSSGRNSTGWAAVPRPPRARRRRRPPRCRPKRPVVSPEHRARCPGRQPTRGAIQRPHAVARLLGRFVISLALASAFMVGGVALVEPRHQRPGQEHPAGGRAQGRAAHRPVAPTT